MKKILPLSELQIKNAKHKAKPYTIFDGGGLYLLVKPNKTKVWRLKYRINGKERLMTIGLHEDVGLKEARQIREDARRQIILGKDPLLEKELSKKGQNAANLNSFEAVAREWLANRSNLLNESSLKRIQRQLEMNAFPWIGEKAIDRIYASEILALLRNIESRGASETAHRVKSIISRVFRYAGATDRVRQDPCWSLKGALIPVKTQHFAAITSPEKFGLLLVNIDNYVGGVIVRAAMKLAPLLFVRPGELRAMRWADVSLETDQWRFTVPKTKTEHIVPLSTQAIGILKDIQAITGHGKYVFPSPRVLDGSRPLSNSAVLVALRTLGYSKKEMTGHGFRAAARTMLDERLHFRIDLIEAQLAHTVRDPLGRAYNRTQYLQERHEMMQAWSDYLDKLKEQSNTSGLCETLSRTNVLKKRGVLLAT